LLKIAIVNLETLHRRKLTGQNVEDFGIKLKRANEKCDASGGQRRNATPHQRAALGYGSGDEITDAHERAIIEHESTPGCQCCSERDVANALRTTRSTLCAFGGSASPKTMVKTFLRRREFREPAE
jgi:hypothetical protein